MNGKSTTMVFPTSKKVLLTVIQISLMKIRKRGKDKNFTKRKVAFFFLLYLWFPSGIFAGLFKIGQLCSLKGCWEGWAVTPQRSPAGGTWWLIRALCGWCLWICELRYLLFFQMFCNEKFFSGRLNKGVNVGHTTSGSIYQNHICFLRSKLLGMDRF